MYSSRNHLDALVSAQKQTIEQVPPHIQDNLIKISAHVGRLVGEWWKRVAPRKLMAEEYPEERVFVDDFVHSIQDLVATVLRELLYEVLPEEKQGTELQTFLEDFFLFETSIYIQHHIDDEMALEELLENGPTDPTTGAIRYHHFLN